MVDIPKASQHIVLSGEAFNKLTSSLLYIWRRNDEILYIGTGTAGFGRLANNQVLNVKEAVLEDDAIDIYWLPNREAKALEAKLLSEYKTRYNINRVDNLLGKQRPEGHNEILDELMRSLKPKL